MRFATMLAMRLPRPMSVSKSERDLLPLKRNIFSHSARSDLLSSGSFSMPSDRIAWVNIFSPNSWDSVNAMVLR